MSNFIFFLTRNDFTVPNALEIFEEVKETGLDFIGFKDVGIPFEDQKELVDRMRRHGFTIVLEVVSKSEETQLASARAAVKLGVDYLMSGRHIEQMMRILLNSGVKFFPGLGKVTRPAPDLPLSLEGTIQEITNDAKRVEALGADGIDFCPFRYNGDVDRLMDSVMDSVRIPVVFAGSINSVDRIRRVVRLGAWGFTVGSAVFDRKFIPDGGLLDQIEMIMRVNKASAQERNDVSIV